MDAERCTAILAQIHMIEEDVAGLERMLEKDERVGDLSLVVGIYKRLERIRLRLGRELKIVTEGA